MQDDPKAVWSIPYVSVAFFPKDDVFIHIINIARIIEFVFTEFKEGQFSLFAIN